MDARSAAQVAPHGAPGPGGRRVAVCRHSGAARAEARGQASTSGGAGHRFGRTPDRGLGGSARAGPRSPGPCPRREPIAAVPRNQDSALRITYSCSRQELGSAQRPTNRSGHASNGQVFNEKALSLTVLRRAGLTAGRPGDFVVTFMPDSGGRGLPPGFPRERRAAAIDPNAPSLTTASRSSSA